MKNPTVTRRTVDPTRRLIRNLERKLVDRERRLARRTAQLRELASRLSVAEQRERRRLAEFFHDHLQQLLVGAKLKLESLEPTEADRVERVLAETIELLDRAIEETRDLSHELYPADLRICGLPEALESLVARVEATYPLELTLLVETRIGPNDEELAGFLHDAIQELLLNVVKHADAESATVRYGKADDSSLRIEVSDPGRGFPVELADRDSVDELHGLGLLRIRERLAAYGGKLVVRSVPEKGSRVEILAPLDFRPEEARRFQDR